MKDDRKFVSLNGLKYRNWTDSLVKKYLGEPDKLAVNPHYSSGPKIKLYLLEKVENIEKLDEFKDYQLKSTPKRAKQSKIQLKIADKKRQELINYINCLEIDIPVFSRENLYAKAVNHYNDLWEDRGKEDKNATINSDRSFLNRISVNMLRHVFSDYEDMLEEIFGKIGVKIGYIKLKNKILDKISEKYDFLKETCENQKLNIKENA